MLGVAAALAAQALSAADNVGDIVRGGDKYFIVVKHFDTPDRNAQFQKNVETMRRHAAIIDALKKAVAGEPDAQKKAKFSAKLKTAEDDFASNDAKMTEAYSFSSNRAYKMQFLKTDICIPITRDEFGNLTLKDGTKIDASRVRERDGSHLYVLRTVDGEKNNEALQRIFWFDVARRNDIASMRTALASTTDPARQMEILKNISSAETAIKENDQKLKQLCGIESANKYVLEVSDSLLYMQITPEEVEKIKARRKQMGKK